VRVSGLASGLAHAVRPAGSALGLQGQGWALAPIALATRPKGAPSTQGGADPDNARQGEPGDYDLRRANRLAWREYDGLVLLVWRGIRGAVMAGTASEAAAQRRRDLGDPSR
jgi:hypothetical protein